MHKHCGAAAPRPAKSLFCFFFRPKYDRVVAIFLWALTWPSFHAETLRIDDRDNPQELEFFELRGIKVGDVDLPGWVSHSNLVFAFQAIRECPHEIRFLDEPGDCSVFRKLISNLGLIRGIADPFPFEHNVNRRFGGICLRGAQESDGEQTDTHEITSGRWRSVAVSFKNCVRVLRVGRIPFSSVFRRWLSANSDDSLRRAFSVLRFPARAARSHVGTGVARDIT